MEKRTQEHFLRTIDDSLRFLIRLKQEIEKELKGLGNIRERVVSEPVDEEPIADRGEQALLDRKRTEYKEWKKARRRMELVPLGTPKPRKKNKRT
jgi:uncharacterized GH25 family protein